MTNGSSAYDLSLFESKESRVISLEQNKRAETDRKKRHRFQSALNAAVTSLVAIGVVTVIGMLIFSRVQLTEMNNQISQRQEELSELIAENKRLEGQLAADTSAQKVEEYAQQNGMTSVNADQVLYVPIESGNQLEISGATEDGLFDQLLNSVKIFFEKLVYPSE